MIDGSIQAATSPLSPDKSKLILLFMKQRCVKVQFTKAAVKIITEKIMVVGVYRFQSTEVS